MKHNNEFNTESISQLKTKNVVDAFDYRLIKALKPPYGKLHIVEIIEFYYVVVMY